MIQASFTERFVCVAAHFQWAAMFFGHLSSGEIEQFADW